MTRIAARWKAASKPHARADCNTSTQTTDLAQVRTWHLSDYRIDVPDFRSGSRAVGDVAQSSVNHTTTQAKTGRLTCISVTEHYIIRFGLKQGRPCSVGSV